MNCRCDSIHQASSSSSDTGSASNTPPSNADDAENESAPDLDASMVDMDDPEVDEDEGTGGGVDQDLEGMSMDGVQEQ